ncbi:hypothetical protein [Tenacibaculum litopenaei]|uniref:hypothetical protein n=1 Tax=Tenacibaculum litopenaei TaxID=396016 RepID=UPI0038B4C0A9
MKTQVFLFKLLNQVTPKRSLTSYISIPIKTGSYTCRTGIDTLQFDSIIFN